MTQSWQDRYQITSRTGRIWDCDMVISGARRGLGRMLALTRDELTEVLEDETFMRPMTGMVPAHVCREVAFEAYARRTRKDRT